MIDRLPAFPAPPASLSTPASKESAASVPAFLPWALPHAVPSPSSGTAPESGSTASGTVALEPGMAVETIPHAPATMPALAFQGSATWLVSTSPTGDAVSDAMPAIPAPQLAADVPPSSISTPGGALSGARVPGMHVPNAWSPDAGPLGLPRPDVPVQPAEPRDRESAVGAWLHTALHFTAAGGGPDVVIVPLRLRALGTLAQSPTPPGGFAAPPVIDAAVATSGDPRSAARVSMPVNTRIAAGDAAGEGTAALDTQDPRAVVARQEETDAPEEIPASRAGTPTEAAAWLARWVGFIQRTGRPPSLWLRDYRLDPDDARRLADMLHRTATADGIVLDRIVVNGRELWRDAQARPFREPRE
ncbi:MAG: hypothetical protein ACTHOH_03250 [Lysobacteraceae bacterium]